MERLAKKMAKKLASSGVKHQIRSMEVDGHLQEAVRSMLNSNGAIVLDDLSEMVALELNCPVLRVNSTNLFGRTSRRSVVNTMLEKEAIAVFAPKSMSDITSELDRILSDHIHCAGIMSNFQEAKDAFGTPNAIRTIARDLYAKLDVG